MTWKLEFVEGGVWVFSEREERRWRKLLVQEMPILRKKNERLCFVELEAVSPPRSSKTGTTARVHVQGVEWLSALSQLEDSFPAHFNCLDLKVVMALREAQRMSGWAAVYESADAALESYSGRPPLEKIGR